jgi:hypothetical protein
MFFLRNVEGRLEGLPLGLDAEHRNALHLVDQAPDGVPGGEEVVLPRHGEGSQHPFSSFFPRPSHSTTFTNCPGFTSPPP